jgi:tetratricopeptide (TPR) repeat protein
MSAPALSFQQQVEFVVNGMLESVHPLMVDAFHIAALPLWCPISLFSLLRNRDDQRDQGLIERLQTYSFISTTESRQSSAEVGLAVDTTQRRLILAHWITQDPEQFRAAHARSLAYWQDHPDPNSFAQQQTLIYHRFFVDFETAVIQLINQFRIYSAARLFAAGDRLVEMAADARYLLDLLPPDEGSTMPPGLGELITFLRIRLDQLRGRWDDRRDELRSLRFNADLQPNLIPFVARARGHLLLHDREYVDAIHEYKFARDQLSILKENPFIAAISSAEQAATLVALGDAHVAFAESLRSPQVDPPPAPAWWQRTRSVAQFLLSLPLVIYLSIYLRRPVWRTRMGRILFGMDWIVARLYAAGVHYYRQAEEFLENQTADQEWGSLGEKLGTVYLALGDPEAAIQALEPVEKGDAGMLSGYRWAVLHTRQAEATLQLDRPEEAAPLLEEAIPLLEKYEDHRLALQARALLAEAYWSTGRHAEALQEFSTCAAAHRTRSDWEAATAVVERLALLQSQQKELPADLNTQAEEIVDSLPCRRYAVAFSHPMWRLVQASLFMLLAVILFCIPLYAIRLQPVFELKPTIRLNIEVRYGGVEGSGLPEFAGIDPQDAVHELAANAVPGEALVWVSMIAILLYLILSLLLGLSLIAWTPLRLIERYVRNLQIEIDEAELRIGSGTSQRVLPVEQIHRLVSANVGFRRMPVPNFSTFTVSTSEQTATVDGNANWYSGLYLYARRQMPSTIRVVQADYWLLYSASAWLYGLALLLLGLLALAVARQMPMLNEFIAGLPYRPVDLYPYLLLLLLPAPLYWFVIRPLYLDGLQDPYSQRAWWLFGFGSLLLLVQILTQFRPLLTGANLIPPLITLCLVLLPLIFLWQARDGDRRIYTLRTLAGFTVLGVVAAGLMGVVLWQESSAYHALAQGNLMHKDPELVEVDCDNLETSAVGKALSAYDQAITLRPLGSMSYSRTTTSTLGIPRADALTPVLAAQNKAALLARLGCHEQAFDLYQTLEQVTTEYGRLYTQMGIVRQAMGSSPVVAGRPGLARFVENSPDSAVEWYSRALISQPGRVELYLWRGFARQVEGNYEAARCDYHRALGTDRDKLPAACDSIEADRARATLVDLTAAQRAQAQAALGWLAFNRSDLFAAGDLFRQFSEDNPQAVEPLIGLGYTYLKWNDYEKAIETAERALKIDPNNLEALVLGSSSHWKMGGRTTATTMCDHYGSAVSYLDRTVQIPDQKPEKLALWHRTLGNLQWLLQSNEVRCRSDRVELLDASIASYDEAIALAPDNADYLHMRARLRTARWVVPGVTDSRRTTPLDEWLEPIYRDLSLALEMRADDEGGYRPNWFTRDILVPVLFEDARLALSTEPDRALRIYTVSVDLAQHVQRGFEKLNAERRSLNRYLSNNPQEVPPSLQAQLIELFFNSDALFDDAITLLGEAKIADAQPLYAQGLDLAIEEKNVRSPADALRTTVIATNGEIPKGIFELFTGASPALAAIARKDEVASDAFKLGVQFTILQDEEAAAHWFNHGVFWGSKTPTFQDPITQVREDLVPVWKVRPTDISSLVKALEDSHLVEWPELEKNGDYWRYRSLFLFHLGRAAFVAEDEAGARQALDAAILAWTEEKARMLTAQAGSLKIETYFPEGGWGWYHTVRGNDYVAQARIASAQGDATAETAALLRALDDYAAAVDYFRPDKNDVARSNQVDVAFQAGATAAQLRRYTESIRHYRQAIALVEEYTPSLDLTRTLSAAIATLETLIQADPDFADVDERLLDDLRKLLP